MSKSLKFKLEDREKFINHWMLSDNEAAQLIAETPEWVEDRMLVAKVTVNGVELSFDAVEKYFQEIYAGLEGEIRAQYADMETEVQRRLEKRMKEEAEPILDKLRSISDVLEDAGNLIKPYWERGVEG